jgi:uncharacterized protein YjbJ (UPF0337 family)
MAKSSARDKSGGAVQVVAGRVKEAFGALTGRIDRRSQGQAKQMKGAAKNRRGHVKSRLR